MPFDGRQISDVTKVLISGKKELEDFGWIQGHCRTDDGVCALGAVYFCGDTTSFFDQEGAICCLAKATGRTQVILDVSDAEVHVAHWNDNPDRTKAEVLALYDRAIILSLAKS